MVLLIHVSPTRSAYNGGLASDDAIVGTRLWIDPLQPGTMSWRLSEIVTHFWRYSYVLSVRQEDTRHLIIETPEGFDMADLLNIQGDFDKIEIGWFKQGRDSPFMPEPIHDVEFDGTEHTAVTIAFACMLEPTWGDFYAKGGKTDHITNTAWNAGFTPDDDDSSGFDGSGDDDHIPVPAKHTSLPEATTVGLFLSGLTVLAARHLRRRVDGAGRGTHFHYR
jgi:hypothetical protein